MKTTLVLYVFHEWNVYVEYFLQKGCFPSPLITFVLISNGCDQIPHDKIPAYVELLQRENKYFDFITKNFDSKISEHALSRSKTLGPPKNSSHHSPINSERRPEFKTSSAPLMLRSPIGLCFFNNLKSRAGTPPNFASIIFLL